MPPVATALIAMLAVQIIVSLAALTGPVLAPLAAAELGIEPTLVGAYVSIVYALAAAAGLMSGGFIGRFGALRVSQACLVLSGAGVALVAIGTPASVLLGAIVLGAGYGPATPASSHVLARVSPPRRLNLVFSLKQTGVPLGNALAGAIAPPLALLAGWRNAALAIGGVCVLLAFVVQPLRGRLDAERVRHLSLFTTSQIVGPLKLAFASPALRQLAVSSFAYSGMQVSLSAFLVTYLNQRLGLDLVAAGLMLSAAQAAGVAGRVVWGLVADRGVEPRRLLGFLGFGMTLFAVLTGLFTPAWPYAAMFAVSAAFGATAVAWNGVYLAQIARLSPPGRAGEVTGGTSFLTFGGVMVTPLVFSAILAGTDSYLLGFTLAALLTLASGLSYFTAAARESDVARR